MASTIKIKNSSTAGAVPGSGDLVQGELAVNVTDKKIYTKNASGTVVNLGTTPSITDNGNATAITIDSSENIGIGVSPSSWVNSSTRKALQLPAVGQVAASGTMVLYSNSYYNGTNDIYTTTGAAGVYTIAGNVHSWGQQVSGTAEATLNFSTAMTLDASGNLGVGTTSPSQKLHVAGNVYVTGDTFRIKNSASNTSFIRTEENASTAAYTYATMDGRSTGYWAFSTNDTERARIDSNGTFKNVATLNYGLSSAVTAAAGTSTAVFIARYSATAGDTGSGTNSFIVWSNGNVVNTNNSYGAISDIKLKENITDTTPKLADLMQVRVRNYNLKNAPEQKQLGVIAQELEQVFPSMVDESPDRDTEGNDLGTTTKQVKYSVFVPMLIKAIQEQQAIIESLTARITALEA